MLTLAEELLLLALDDSQGTISWSKQDGLKYGLVGSLLAELVLSGRIRIDEKKKLLLSAPTSTGDEILDEVAGRIGQSKKPKDMKGWVTDLAGWGGMKKLQERLENRLVERGILRREEARFLKLFPTEHYPTLNSAPEQEEKERIRSVVLGSAEPDGRTVAMVGLMKACDLTDRVFSKEEKKQVKKRVEELARGEFAGKAVSDAIAEMAAVMAAISAATIAATVSSSSSGSS